jgi:multidrug efflux pump subunit AcrA (membrane-fusion protein)
VKVSPKNSKKRTFILLSLVISITLITLFVLSGTKEKVRSSSVKEKQWDVSAHQVQLGSYAPHYKAFGHVLSPETTTLTANVSGIVQSVHHLAGEAVSLNQRLISIDPTETQRLVDQRQAELTEAKANLSNEKNRQAFENTTLNLQKELLALTEKSVSRIKQLQKKSLSADSDLESALMAKTQQALQVNQTELSIANHKNQTALLNARVIKASTALEQANDYLEDTQVTAPFNARITQVNISAGDRVNKGNPLMTLYSVDQLELSVDIPEHTADTLRQQLITNPEVSQHIYARVIIGEQSHHLPLHRLSGEIQRGSGGLQAIFRFPTLNENAIGLGMTLGKTLACDLVLPPQANTFVVPASAIYQSKYIYTIQSKRLKSIPVKRLGFWHPEESSEEQSSSFVIVKADIKEGDQILSSLLPNAMDGLKVKVHPQ